MLDTAHRLARADAVCVIGVGVAIKGCKLSALFPSQGMTEIARRVALRYLYYNKANAKSQQKPPRAVP